MDTLGIGLKTWLGKKSPDYARTLLQALSVACPTGTADQQCPLSAIRSKPQEQKNKWVESLSDQEISALFSYHYKCLEKNTEKA